MVCHLLQKCMITILNIVLINEIIQVFGQFAGGRERTPPSFPNRGYSPGKLHPCEKSSCYPATGNLLIGREEQLYASSTCGLHGQQRYCIVSHLQERKKCFWCDSRPSNKPNPTYNHNISNIVYRVYPGTLKTSWWQSENGKENVYIQLDLEAEFHFTHIIITFKTFRPAAMLIERSYDTGKTWHVYRYFAHRCHESFPNVPTDLNQRRNLSDVICQHRYSDVAPSTGGEVIYRVLPHPLQIDNPYSDQVQNMLKITNLRINFTKLHTLGDDLLDRREEIQEKYYYAITDMVVRGSCSCYGHANRCLPLPGIDPKPDMVHGRCECTHNTKGRNCEKCEDFFNDLPWRPAIGKQTNACQKCNCNNHAISCHYDEAVYNASYQISGGVCDGCMHNTMGKNCEQCKQFYYKDPTRDIQDPEVCRPCDCDPVGSEQGGICDSVTDAANGLVAGTCHCKPNVDGRRCDTCKNGFWNFTSEGCQPCKCNTFGTINNQGCSMDKGECFCKRYVTGEKCDQCLPEFWGLSDSQVGCQPCNCDPGGSLDNFCDVINGQCRCREHMNGRACDIPLQKFFTANLDFLMYEAELTSGGSVVIREPHLDGTPTTWTGNGFKKAFEGSKMEFAIDDIKTSMEYDIVIRYEPTSPESWEDVRVTVRRPGAINPNGPCGTHYPEEDVKQTGLPSTSRSVTVFPPACLEAGQSYIIELEFRRFNYQRQNPSASVLIDSVALIPRIEQLPMFHGSAVAEQRRQEFERNRCGDPSYLIKGAKVPEVCKQYHTSIGSYIFNGAFSCDCHPQGATSRNCDPNGGFCTCRVNVVGRRCDRCAPGTYGFGPKGCVACDCNSIGSLDNFCDATTGQCKCRPNTYGQQCNECQNGFWNFPNCQRCECNGHAESCDAVTGACLKCADNTEGHYCERCVTSYYGDPRLDVNIPCRPCPCPGITANHSHADSCSLDPYTKNVVCDCEEGYQGARCDLCADDYYGNPEEPDGFCELCECNNKIEMGRPGNCDPHTGKCLQCLYDTTGDHCEICKPNYFRYAEDRMCEECVCHPLGTNATAGPCDPHSGQCHCLPNVDGLKCDQCIEAYWKIASGNGCESCDCDEMGSYSFHCNEFDGQCQCKPGFGGRRCNECMAQFWGDPNIECNPCECDIRGSQTMQCDMQTGACICLPGIGGYHCNECARGYVGRAPNCQPCGECFDNWDRILQESKNQTTEVIRKAKEIKLKGATGAYTKEFEEMQSQLDEIINLLNNTADVNVDEIREGLDYLLTKLNKTEHVSIAKLNNALADTKQDILLANSTLESLKKGIDEAIRKAKELKENSTNLQEANVQGALVLVEQAKQKADQAVMKANHTKVTIKYADRQCAATENFLNASQETFNNQLKKNSEALQDMQGQLQKLENTIPDLNDLVCDGRGDPCDSICGGVGCGHCGNSISCKDGAKQLAETALAVANTTEGAIRNKETAANEFIRAISQIDTNRTRNIAHETYEKAKHALEKSNSTQMDYVNLLFDIQDFASQNNTKPDDIKKLANEVLEKKIDADDETIMKLANEIRETVNALTNTEPIIEATRDDLQRVNRLKQNAENLKDNATALLENAEVVNKELEETTEAQKEAEGAINQALGDVEKVNALLYQIGNETEGAQQKTNATQKHIEGLRERVNQLQRNITENGIYAKQVMNISATTMNTAQKTYDDFNNLKDRYDQAKVDLSENIFRVRSSKDRVDTLLKKAVNLVSQVTNIQQEITKLENNSQDGTLYDLEDMLQELIGNMDRYTRVIEERLDYYKICTN